MPQSLSRVLVHLVFSTKNRDPYIPADLRDRTSAYLGGTLAALDCPPVRVGGTSDHVHLLFVPAKTLAVSRVVEEVKKESSKWAKLHVHPNFYWQNGYGAFSVSPSKVAAVRKRCGSTPKIKKSTTGQCRFRTSSASCCGDTGLIGTGGMCGIEPARSLSGCR